MEGGVKAGTAVTVCTKGYVIVGAVGDLPTVPGGVGAGVAAGIAAGVAATVGAGAAAVVAAGLAVLPALGVDGVPMGVKKKPAGGGDAPDAGLGDAVAGREAAAGLAGLTSMSLITGVPTGVADGVGRNPIEGLGVATGVEAGVGRGPI